MSGVLTRNQRRRCVDPNDRDHTCLDSSRELQVELFRKKKLRHLLEEKEELRQRHESTNPDLYQLLIHTIEHNLALLRQAHWTEIMLPGEEGEECEGCGHVDCLCDGH